jgi:hypothetical protein
MCMCETHGKDSLFSEQAKTVFECVYANDEKFDHTLCAF